MAGIVSAWYCYLVNPALPEKLKRAAGPIYTLLDQKYYFDRFNDWFFAGGARAMGSFLSTVGDRTIIDGFFVNGTARLVGWTASLVRHVQSGYVYHYAFTMILGVFALLTWWTRERAMMPYLSLSIWVPIVAGLAVLAVGRDRDAAAARWIALAGAIAGLVVTLPLWMHFDTAPRTCSSSSAASGFRASTSTISWASTASRCCSCCSTA